MQKDITRSTQTTSYVRTSIVDNEAAGTDFQQVFPYQKKLFGRILWPSKDSILRIVPGNDGTHTFPQVINADTWTTDGDQTNYLSDTFYMTYTLSGFGDSKCDICSNLKPGSDEAAMYPESPLNYFCNKIHRTMRYVLQGKGTKVRYNDKWRMWTGLQGTLPFPRPTLMFQAICVHLCGRDCLKEGEGTEQAPLYGVIGINNKTSIGELVKALVAPMDRRRPIGTNNNTYGALAEASGNVLYLNSTMDTQGHKYLQPSIQSSSAPANSWEPQQYNLTEDLCKQLWVPWNKVLKYYTVKEQLELIASEFGADTVNYVFSLSPQWEGLQIPERIAAVGMGQYAENAQRVPSYSAFGQGVQKQAFSSDPRQPSSSSVASAIPSFGRVAQSAFAPSNTTPLASTAASPSVSMDSIKAELAKIRAAANTVPSGAGALASAMLNDLELPPDDDVYDATGEESLGIE